MKLVEYHTVKHPSDFCKHFNRTYGTEARCSVLTLRDSDVTSNVEIKIHNVPFLLRLADVLEDWQSLTKS